MVTEALAVGPRRGWGTWEELVLGGAVLRHGTQDWNVVASVLRARTPCPFTPEACKAKYKDLQQRYSGSRGWFEELRKQRVAELKLELARSEDSIGSLESKIKTLEEDKEHSNQADYSSQTESALPSLNSYGTESFGKEASKGENSAGSFTGDTRTRTSNFLELQHQSEETDTKPDASVSSEHDRHTNIIIKLAETSYGQGATVRKRRGQRKRKDCNRAAREGSVGESVNLCSSHVVPTAQKETSTNDCGTIIKESDRINNHGQDPCSATGHSLMEIFTSIAQTDPASVFKHRMDSQKRARYRKIIRQHVDISTIRSRIVKRSIKSVKELFSDLLLLANNALVFYSRRTREYKSALSLRDLVMKEYKKHCRGSCQEALLAFLPCNPPVKPRSARRRPPPCKDRVPVIPAAPEVVEKPCDSDTNVLLQSLLRDKKGLKRAGQIKPGFADPQPEISPVKQRKRNRR